jgi:hypothetical protein
MPHRFGAAGELEEIHFSVRPFEQRTIAVCARRHAGQAHDEGQRVDSGRHLRR